MLGLILSMQVALSGHVTEVCEKATLDNRRYLEKIGFQLVTGTTWADNNAEYVGYNETYMSLTQMVTLYLVPEYSAFGVSDYNTKGAVQVKRIGSCTQFGRVFDMRAVVIRFSVGGA